MSAPTEHKVERYNGFLMHPETFDVRPSEGIRILWRFEGERRWRRQVIVADEGQTTESLTEDAPRIVALLAERAGVER